jgi:hypothetical protein
MLHGASSYTAPSASVASPASAVASATPTDPPSLGPPSGAAQQIQLGSEPQKPFWIRGQGSGKNVPEYTQTPRTSAQRGPTLDVDCIAVEAPDVDVVVLETLDVAAFSIDPTSSSVRAPHATTPSEAIDRSHPHHMPQP